MSIIDNAIKANRKYSHTHNPKLALAVPRKLLPERRSALELG